MAEVENLCDRLAILSGGKIAFIGTVDQLNEAVGKHYNIAIQLERIEYLWLIIWNIINQSLTNLRHIKIEYGI